ncbi:MAG: enoyl-CoA hydratase-related protein [Armatimonadota bacterium]|nr:enoyl-CoA hydratase-related protein [Armatimonadota bacterium]
MEVFKPRPAEEFEFQEILYEKRDGIARVTINRPHAYNAYTTRTLWEMFQAFQDAAWDDSISVLVLTGAGDKAFCTGGDVKEYAAVYTRKPREYWKYMTLFAMTHDMLRNLGKPAIARLNGIVAGGGNEFNMACDLAIAAEHVTIRQVGTRVGSVAAGGATQWLPIMIGDRRAREMLFLCEPITAQQALEWGLVNQVVPYTELDAAVEEMCQKIIRKFPECTRYTKQQVNFWKDLAWHATIGHARDWLSLHFACWEPLEGMTAFVEKREPRYLEIRQRLAEGLPTEFPWGGYVRSCPSCGASFLPEGFRYCGQCGAVLPSP